MKKGAKKDFEKGKLSAIVTRKDFDKMDKDFNRQHKEIALIQNSSGVTAASPEEALKNLCDIHFPTAMESTLESIQDAHLQYGNKLINQRDHEWISTGRIKLAIDNTKHHSPWFFQPSNQQVSKIMKLIGTFSEMIIGVLFSLSNVCGTFVFPGFFYPARWRLVGRAKEQSLVRQMRFKLSNW